jgi:hypothetical protein
MGTTGGRSPPFCLLEPVPEVYFLPVVGFFFKEAFTILEA